MASLQVLVAGAILAAGKRSVSATLRVMGLGQTEHFQRYHRVLNRAVWSGSEVSGVLVGLLVKTFCRGAGGVEEGSEIGFRFFDNTDYGASEPEYYRGCEGGNPVPSW